MNTGERILAEAVERFNSQDGEKSFRVERAKKEFFYFCQTYLAHYFKVESAPYQQVLIDVCTQGELRAEHVQALKPYIAPKYHSMLKRGKLRGIIDVEPREHGKTVRMSLAYPLWMILTARSRYAVIFSASQDLASQNLSNIKSELEENEKLLRDFGDLTRSGEWRNNKIILANGAAMAARGATSSVRGLRHREARPDLLIVDDLIRDQDVNSATTREMLYRRMKRTIIPLGKDTTVVMVNSIFHHDDLPSRMMREIIDNSLPGWMAVRFSAMVKGQPLWASYWSATELATRKKEVGVLAWSTEYMSEPVAEEHQVFKLEWIQRYQAHELPQRLKLVMGVDPAVGGHDRSAIVILGSDSNARLYVLRCWAKSVSTLDFIDKVIALYNEYRPQRILFEQVSFQRIYKDYLIDKARSLGVLLPVKGVSPQATKKETRLLKLSPLVENGTLKLPEQGAEELIDEMLTFPKGEYDDLLDALYYAVENNKVGQARAWSFGKKKIHERW